MKRIAILGLFSVLSVTSFVFADECSNGTEQTTATLQEGGNTNSGGTAEDLYKKSDASK